MGNSPEHTCPPLGTVAIDSGSHRAQKQKEGDTGISLIFMGKSLGTVFIPRESLLRSDGGSPNRTPLPPAKADAGEGLSEGLVL